jgi:SAM-dependent methyltransferase
MGLWKDTHAIVHGRRVRKLCEHISDLLPQGAAVLDVGCGDGILASLIGQERPDVTVTGLDVLLRPAARIPVIEFDGKTLPFADNSFDIVMFVDVLHHTEDPSVLLREAKRVSRAFLVIKDHTNDGFLSDLTLRFMDWFGNKPHGVALPYNYWAERTWRRVLSEMDIEIMEWRADLRMYPFPADMLFGRGLHMLTKLRV